MSDEVEEVVEKKETPETPETQEQPEVSETEKEARKMGWTPKDEFKGDPEKWRDAYEFVERGKNMLPIMRATAQRQEKKIADLERSIKEFAEYHSKAEQLAYNRALKDLKARQVAAVEIADTETFNRIDKEIDDLNRNSIQVPRVPQQNNAEDPVYVEWANRNKWIEKDKTMLAYAETQGEFIHRTTDLRGLDFLEAVEKEVKAKFPEKFTNPRRESAQSVEGATTQTRKSGKTFADMPADARAACERMEKSHGIKRTEFVKNFFEQE